MSSPWGRAIVSTTVESPPLSRPLLPEHSAEAGSLPGTRLPSRRRVCPGGVHTPLPRTVIPAPSYAPISEGSCSCSARLPLSVASQPSTASSGTGQPGEHCGLACRRRLRQVGSVVLPTRFRATVGAGWIVHACRSSPSDGTPLQRQAEQAVDMPAPGIEQLARRKGIGIDDGRSGAHTLQPDRLPHQSISTWAAAKRFDVASLHEAQWCCTLPSSGSCRWSCKSGRR